MKAPIPQGLTGSPNYFGVLNNLMTLNICESLREIGEMACVTSAWSSRGQTLKSQCRNISRISNQFRKIEFWFIPPKQPFGMVISENDIKKSPSALHLDNFRKVHKKCNFYS